MSPLNVMPYPQKASTTSPIAAAAHKENDAAASKTNKVTAAAKKKFDLQESLKRPVTWEVRGSDCALRQSARETQRAECSSDEDWQVCLQARGAS